MVTIICPKYLPLSKGDIGFKRLLQAKQINEIMGH